MVAFEKHITIEDPQQIDISDLPVRPGQRVKVVVIVEDGEREKRVAELRSLLSATQSLASARRISDDDIATEVAAYRASRPCAS
jgi:hypothetical protein